jgi:hypothetical protein
MIEQGWAVPELVVAFAFVLVFVGTMYSEKEEQEPRIQ